MTEETLFHEALAKPPVERAAFLDAACTGQPQVREAVEALLAAHEASGSFLRQPAVAELEATGAHTPQPQEAPPLVPTTDYHPQSEPGVVIAGRYVLQEKIGEGGMGEVWVAKQTEPVKRKVALKLIKTGMDSKAVLTRFEQERQALAMMDHPHIARVLDGGLDLVSEPRTLVSGLDHPLTSVRGSGMPFFVMELVNGLPLTKFCDEARLTPRERLELFVPICQAVQHAHQKGIVHRDLKPSNILVTLIDGRAIPKVIDFGVAKATGGKLTDESLSTQFGAIVGTLEYMSPEQAGFSGVDVDTRADIYSLGVILYELLTGLRPIDAKRLRQAVYTEMIRIIQEEEPSKPSTRLSTDEALPSLAAARQIEPKKLMAMLRGELDWVVMKCLEKQRDRRYETASGLARDIQRYLADEPVEARPPSAGYRLSKFLQRNKGPVLAASLVLLTLIGGIVGTTYGMIRAEHRRVEADEARLREAEQRTKAEKARDRTRQALDAMTSSVTGDSLSTQKAISEEQKKFLKGVLTYYREFAGEKADDEASRARTAAAASRVGHIEYRLGRKEEATAAFRLARDGYRKLAADFPTVSAYRGSLASSHLSLGLVLANLGQRSDAEEQYGKALAISEKLIADMPTVPEYRQELAKIHNNLGNLLNGLGKRPEAEEQHRKALTIREKLADEFPAVPEYRKDLAQSHNNLGVLLKSLGKRPQAEEQYRKALAIQKKLADDFLAVPEYRQQLARSHYNLGNLLASLGRRPEAEEQHRKSLAICEKLTAEYAAVAEYRQDLAQSHNTVGVLLYGLRKWPGAEEQYRRALAIQEKLAADSPAVPDYRKELAKLHNNLGNLLHDLGKRPEAEEQLRKALAINEKLAADFPAVPEYRKELAQSHNNLGVLLADHGKHREAEQQFRNAVILQEKLAAEFRAVPEYQIDLGGSYLNVGKLSSYAGQPGASLAWYEKATRTLTPVYEQDPQLVVARQFLRSSHLGRAQAYDRLRNYAEAVKDWDRAIELSPRQEQPGLRAGRATSRVQAGQVADAVAEVAELTKNTSWPAEQWYDFACVYALASAKSGDNKQRYAERAMELLGKAVKAGYQDSAHMKKDTDLDPLRKREDFTKLIAELEKKAPAKAEKQP